MTLKDARELAHRLMREHGLVGWAFQFDNSKSRFGVCKYGNSTISLSAHITRLNDVQHVQDTLLHEIAHALVGRGHGHGNVWRRKAIEIGCNGQRCYSGELVQTPEPKYKGTCPNCGDEFKRHRRTSSACSKCCNRFNGGRYSEQYKLVWTLNRSKTPH